MKNINRYLIFMTLLTIIMLPFVSSHGVDVTADKMVIADESNGQQIKDLADQNNLNISVYKFTSDAEVEHQLEHMLNNTNKYIIVCSYQDVAQNFLNEHDEIKDRLIILKDYDDESLLSQMNKISTTNTTKDDNFMTALLSGIIVGILFGIAVGVIVMKKK